MYVAQQKKGKIFCSRECANQFHREHPYEFQDYISDEGRKNRSDASKKAWQVPGFRENQVRTRIGKIASEETKQKMRDSAHRGEEHHNWRGGCYTEDFEISHKMSINDWDCLSKEIRNRDNHECRLCGASGLLHVHHIIPRFVAINNTPQNLVTLCASCHPKVERKWQDYVNFFQINNIQRESRNE